MLQYSFTRLRLKSILSQMENIGNYLSSCENYGVPKTDLFQTVDLYEGQNMAQVINGIVALGRKVRPDVVFIILMKHSTANSR